MTKEQRLRIYAKFGGRCAYCGRLIEYKDMQVDHISAKYPMVCDGADKAAVNAAENLNPSCRMCNFRKGTLGIEEFRAEIRLQAEREMQRFQARMSAAYGLIEYREDKKIKFYFETQQQRK